MQIMEHICHTSGWAMVIARSLAVRKSLFSLTAALCVLLLLIGDGETAEGGGTENATENLAFSGRVVNSSGDPVTGAEILYAVNWQTTQLVGRTATDGTFHFEIARPEPKKSGERLDILITHADYANRWRKLPLENTANIEIQLDAPGKISGRILNLLRRTHFQRGGKNSIFDERRPDVASSRGLFHAEHFSSYAACRDR